MASVRLPKRAPSGDTQCKGSGHGSSLSFSTPVDLLDGTVSRHVFSFRFGCVEEFLGFLLIEKVVGAVAWCSAQLQCDMQSKEIMWNGKLAGVENHKNTWIAANVYS